MYKDIVRRERKNCNGQNLGVQKQIEIRVRELAEDFPLVPDQSVDTWLGIVGSNLVCDCEKEQKWKESKCVVSFSPRLKFSSGDFERISKETLSFALTFVCDFDLDIVVTLVDK